MDAQAVLRLCGSQTPEDRFSLDWPQSLMSIFFSKTDSLSKTLLGSRSSWLGSVNLTIREDRIFR